MLVSTNIHSNNLIHFNYGISQYLSVHCIFYLLLQKCLIYVQNKNENRIAKENIFQEITYRQCPSKKWKLRTQFGPIISFLQHFLYAYIRMLFWSAYLFSSKTSTLCFFGISKGLKPRKNWENNKFLLYSNV
jgi:hypothetical protein